MYEQVEELNGKKRQHTHDELYKEEQPRDGKHATVNSWSNHAEYGEYCGYNVWNDNKTIVCTYKKKNVSIFMQKNDIYKNS